ncbi:unnamed protein product, partial [Rotaria magnacalcarata]
QLKEDVENAIQKELLQRLSLQEKSSTFGLRDQDFPPLATSDNHSNKKWNIAQLRTTVESTLINGLQLNHQIQLIPTSHSNNIVQTDQQYSSVCKSTQNPKDEAMHRLKTWNFPTKDQKLVLSLLDEWYTGRTLNTILEGWEHVGIASLRNQQEYIKILCYNVEGWGTRAVEAIDLVYKAQASICIFTNVEELWNTCRLPHFNTLYQKGTNKNGGVC